MKQGRNKLSSEKMKMFYLLVGTNNAYFVYVL